MQEILVATRRKGDRRKIADRRSEGNRRVVGERRLAARRHKAKGTKLGRPMTSPKTEAQIMKLRSKGKGMLAIGKELGVGTSVVQRVVKQSAASATQSINN